MNKELEEKLYKRINELPYTKHLDDGLYNDGQVSGFEQGAKFMFDLLTWKPIDKDNLPSGELLVKNGRDEYMVGLLSKLLDMVFCQNHHAEIRNCTHYIDLKNFDAK